MMNGQEANIPVLQVRNIKKSFGKVEALKGVSLEVHKGDILGLMGDNGAGKSTLIKIIAGNYRADEGEIFLDGKKVEFNSPAESRAAGIETVYQNSPVCENASVTSNFFIGRELCGRFPMFRVLKERTMQKETEKVLLDMVINVPSVRTKVGLLSGGQRQAIVLGRFFHWGGKLALLDEPFAALGVAESKNGLRFIKDLGKRGLPIILITHNIEYALQVANKFVILRHGLVSGQGMVADVTADDIVSMITGAINVNQ
jgi:D-xylose transport system ATP-binding protein